MQLQFEYLIDHPEHVATVIRWWQTVWADRMGSTEESENILRKSLSRDQFPIHVLAMIDGHAVGSAALKKQELADLYPDYHYWLGSVYVDAEYRGARIASALSEHVADMARQHKLPHLYLQTVNTSGGLYAKLGWQPIEEFEYRGERSLLMCRQLESSPHQEPQTEFGSGES